MDAEGLGRKLLLTPRRPSANPEKQTVGTVTASHKRLTLQALSSSLNAATAKRGCLSRGKAFESPPAVCRPERPRPLLGIDFGVGVQGVAGRRNSSHNVPKKSLPSTAGTSLSFHLFFRISRRIAQVLRNTVVAAQLLRLLPQALLWPPYPSLGIFISVLLWWEAPKTKDCSLCKIPKLLGKLVSAHPTELVGENFVAFSWEEFCGVTWTQEFFGATYEENS